MGAKTYHIKAEAGATFLRTIYWKADDGTPVDLTGYSGRMHVRVTRTATEILAELTTEGGEISISGGDGAVTLQVSATETDTWPAGSYVYDLELEKDGIVTRLVEGNFLVHGAVTR